MKPLFNSLGSNYNWSLSLLALRQLIWPENHESQHFAKQLSTQFAGEATLVYKGRDAIEYGLREMGIGAGDEVITQAFSCYAIEEAIVRAGATPLFTDLAPQKLNPAVATVEKAYKKAKRPKAVLIQHTLGIPADIKAIKTWCQRHRLLLIEDIAQGVGGTADDGTSVGSFGDVVILSFGRDKMVDAVSGGACIIRHTVSNTSPAPKVDSAFPLLLLWQDMTYPVLMWLIRHTHQGLIGQGLFQVLKQIGWFTSPVKTQIPHITYLPSAYAALATYQWTGLSDQVWHRRQLAQQYHQQLEWQKGQIEAVVSVEELTQASNLRYSLWVKEPSALIQYLAKHQIYISDRWYRRPIDCGSLGCHTLYQAGSCPRAEELAEHLVNLPTHQEIDSSDVKRICTLINKYFAQTPS